MKFRDSQLATMAHIYNNPNYLHAHNSSYFGYLCLFTPPFHSLPLCHPILFFIPSIDPSIDVSVNAATWPVVIRGCKLQLGSSVPLLCRIMPITRAFKYLLVYFLGLSSELMSDQSQSLAPPELLWHKPCQAVCLFDLQSIFLTIG